jgi:hypothetical protein
MALTFDALIVEWATLHLSHRRPRYATETARTIRKGLPGLLNRPAIEITRAEAVNAIDKIVLAKPGAARAIGKGEPIGGSSDNDVGDTLAVACPLPAAPKARPQAARPVETVDIERAGTLNRVFRAGPPPPRRAERTHRSAPIYRNRLASC